MASASGNKYTSTTGGTSTSTAARGRARNKRSHNIVVESTPHNKNNASTSHYNHHGHGSRRGGKKKKRLDGAVVPSSQELVGPSGASVSTSTKSNKKKQNKADGNHLSEGNKGVFTRTSARGTSKNSEISFKNEGERIYKNDQEVVCREAVLALSDPLKYYLRSTNSRSKIFAKLSARSKRNSSRRATALLV